LRKKRQSARESASRRPEIGDADLHSEFLDIVHNLRKAENEVKFGDYFADTMGSLMSSQLSRLQEERLKLVLLANLAFEPTRRGESFPHSNIDEKVKVRPVFLSTFLHQKP